MQVVSLDTKLLTFESFLSEIYISILIHIVLHVRETIEKI